MIGMLIADIDQVFITHYHADHCGLAGMIQDRSGAAIFIQELEYKRTRATAEGNIMLDLMGAFYAREGMPQDVFGRIIHLFEMFKTTAVPFSASHFLVPGKIEVKGLEIEIFDVPGHTAGQVIFLLRERGLLLSGDHVLPHITPNLSPDLLNPSFHPLSSYIESLNRIKNLPVAMVYPAHGQPFHNLRARVEEIKAHHEERKKLILESAKIRPKTVFEISVDIFGTDLPDFDLFLAINETFVHLVELERGSLVGRKFDGEVDMYSSMAE